MGKRVNKRELAELLEYSERTLTDMQSEDPPLPIEHKGERGEQNEYDTAAVITWLVWRAVAKASGAETQRDRLTRLQADAMEMDNQIKRGQLVPVAEIEPVWRGRVLNAASYLLSRASRLASLLEAASGAEKKREVLKQEDEAFLAKLGVNGERMLETAAQLGGFLVKLMGTPGPLAKEAETLLWRISGDDVEPGAAGSAQQSVGAVRPAEEGPAV